MHSISFCRLATLHAYTNTDASMTSASFACFLSDAFAHIRCCRCISDTLAPFHTILFRHFPATLSAITHLHSFARITTIKRTFQLSFSCCCNFQCCPFNSIRVIETLKQREAQRKRSTVYINIYIYIHTLVYIYIYIHMHIKYACIHVYDVAWPRLRKCTKLIWGRT